MGGGRFPEVEEPSSGGGQMNRIALIGAYLSAIVAANLTLSLWGEAHPEVAVYNAFLFIGLDLSCRDALHDMWRGRILRNMAILISGGSLLSYALGLWWGVGTDVGRIAFASAVAFAAASAADSIAYHLLRERTWYERANQSNIVGAAVDSIVFVMLWPFGFNFALAFGLFCAKVAGGVVWSFFLAKGADGRSWLGRQRELRA